MSSTTAKRCVISTRPGTLRDGILIKALPSPYTSSEIVQYLNRVGFPQDPDLFTPSLENLERLMRFHLLAFPFENTAMHYTPEHTMDVSSQGAFQRLVGERKGSYCFGHGTVLLGVLRGLGYRAYSVAGRVNRNVEDISNPDLSGLGHMVLLVQPFPLSSVDSNQTYLVDVWFGSNNPVRPLLLSDAEDNVVMGTTPSERHRLTRGAHPLSSLDDDLAWNLEMQHDKEDGQASTPWRLLYTFTENECFHIDVEILSFVVSQKPKGIFWNNVLCVRYLPFEDLDEEGKDQVSADFDKYPTALRQSFLWKYIMFGSEVKRRIGESSVTIRKLTSELERISVLREIFGLDISDDACEYMKGRSPELGA